MQRLLTAMGLVAIVVSTAAAQPHAGAAEPSAPSPYVLFDRVDEPSNQSDRTTDIERVVLVHGSTVRVAVQAREVMPFEDWWFWDPPTNINELFSLRITLVARSASGTESRHLLRVGSSAPGAAATASLDTSPDCPVTQQYLPSRRRYSFTFAGSCLGSPRTIRFKVRADLDAHAGLDLGFHHWDRAPGSGLSAPVRQAL